MQPFQVGDIIVVTNPDTPEHMKGEMRVVAVYEDGNVDLVKHVDSPLTITARAAMDQYWGTRH